MAELQIALSKKRSKLNEISKIEINVDAMVRRILKFMRVHIGKENALSRTALFSKVFGYPESSFTELQLVALWTLLKRAMHKCRQRTKCFITNEYRNGTYYYFVVKNWQDAQIYDNMVKRTIKALNGMNRRCQRSVEERWHLDDWSY